MAFERWLERVRADLRPVSGDLVRNELTDEVVLRNRDAVEQRARAIEALVEASIAVRDLLWQLPDAELRARIEAFRSKIGAELADDLIGGEPRPGRPGGY